MTLKNVSQGKTSKNYNQMKWFPGIADHKPAGDICRDTQPAHYFQGGNGAAPVNTYKCGGGFYPCAHSPTCTSEFS